MEHQFYLILPSNVKSDMKNVQSRYTTILPIVKNLKGKWECALVEFMYPRTFNNVHTGHDIHTNMQQNQIKVRGKDGVYRNFYVEPGYYSDMEKLIASLNSMLEKQTSIKFTYDDVTKMVKCYYNKDVTDYLMLPSQLKFILGFADEQKNNKKENEMASLIFLKLKTNIGKYPSSLNFKFNNLYIYTNIIEPSIVGDTMVPLLRICNVEGKYGDNVVKVFSTPHYHPVKYDTLNNIEINIKDDLDQFVPFVYGTVIVKLHFRKILPLFL